MNSARRLANGFGIIALGFVAALPFRQAPSMQSNRDVFSVDNSTQLGEDLSLQVPGQVRLANLDSPPTDPLSAESDSEAERAFGAGQAGDLADQGLETFTDPPAMPDQYRPLFQPAKTGPPQYGHVVASDSATPDKPRAKQHTIHDGDTLESLAIRYLGDASRATDIFQANPRVLDDPDVLPIGVEIVIPLDRRAEPAENAQAASDVVQPRLVPLPASLYRKSR